MSQFDRLNMRLSMNDRAQSDDIRLFKRTFIIRCFSDIPPIERLGHFKISLVPHEGNNFNYELCVRFRAEKDCAHEVSVCKAWDVLTILAACTHLWFEILSCTSIICEADGTIIPSPPYNAIFIKGSKRLTFENDGIEQIAEFADYSMALYDKEDLGSIFDHYARGMTLFWHNYLSESFMCFYRIIEYLCNRTSPKKDQIYKVKEIIKQLSKLSIPDDSIKLFKIISNHRRKIAAHCCKPSKFDEGTNFSMVNNCRRIADEVFRYSIFCFGKKHGTIKGGGTEIHNRLRY